LLSNAAQQLDWSKTLSGGEQQKIALVRAIWHKPKLLFMDEPFSAMDLKSKKLCSSILLAYLKNTTIISIDHQGDHKFYDYLVTFKNNRLTQTAIPHHQDNITHLYKKPHRAHLKSSR
jgi:ABC-type uncharacterized transport system fused permease/ATPase subunit